MRTARKRSEGDVYHVVQRGGGGQLIFEQDADRQAFLGLLAKVASEAEGGMEVLAWCLMSNHVHLLLHAEMGEISLAMKRISTSYAMRFNRKYGRRGPLFQDRFWSEPVNDDAYLVQVVRYIHSNPVKVGAKDCGDYPWSSYRAYIGKAKGDAADVTSTELVLGAVGGKDAFVRLHSPDPDAGVSGIRLPSERRIAGDDEAVRAARLALGDVSPYSLRALPREERNAALARLSSAGLSLRQIERVTGMGKSTVHSALKSRE